MLIMLTEIVMHYLDRTNFSVRSSSSLSSKSLLSHRSSILGACQDLQEECGGKTDWRVGGGAPYNSLPHTSEDRYKQENTSEIIIVDDKRKV